MTPKLLEIYQLFIDSKATNDGDEILALLRELLGLVEDIADEAADDCDCFSKREYKVLNEIATTAYQLKRGALSDSIDRRKEI